MKKLPRKLLKSLDSKWVNRDSVPESTDDPAYDVFFDATGELPMIFDGDDLGADAAKLTANQRRAGALILFSTAVPFDGLLIGVFVNQPEIIPHAHEAAQSLGLKKAVPHTKRLVALLPPDLIGKDVDERLAWTESNESAANDILAIEETESFEDGRFEMMHAAIRLVVDHPDEFFKK